MEASQSSAQILGPGGLPFDCNCDPYDCGPASHDTDCPARIPETDWINQHRRAIPMLDALLSEVARQDRAYGRFSPDVSGVRLAAAALEDEAEETRRSWRDERKRDGWPETIVEAIQTAAVAIRLARDAGRWNGV